MSRQWRRWSSKVSVIFWVPNSLWQDTGKNQFLLRLLIRQRSSTKHRSRSARPSTTSDTRRSMPRSRQITSSRLTRERSTAAARTSTWLSESVRSCVACTGRTDFNSSRQCSNCTRISQRHWKPPTSPSIRSNKSWIGTPRTSIRSLSCSSKEWETVSSDLSYFK